MKYAIKGLEFWIMKYFQLISKKGQAAGVCEQEELFQYTVMFLHLRYIAAIELVHFVGREEGFVGTVYL